MAVPDDFLSTTWADGEEVTAAKWFTRILSPLNDLFAVVTPLAAPPELFMVQTAGTLLPIGGSRTTLLNWSSSTSDDAAAKDTIGVTQSAGVLTMPTGSAGTYEFSAVVGILTGSSTTAADGFLMVNSANTYGTDLPSSSATSVTSIALPPRPLVLAAGDTLKFVARCLGQAGTTADTADNPWTSWIRLRKLP